jgi:23S rRNA (guanine745-N1)-methyltransferase
MIEFCCPVRKCGEKLSIDGNRMACRAGHSFDRAKQGYWNLTQPQDRKSSRPGDSDEAVAARHRWLSRGYIDPLIEELGKWVSQPAANVATNEQPVLTTVDLGCGEGSLAPKLFGNEASGYCGIDLSKKALRLAARNWPEATWVLANADRTLPLADNSIDRVISLFGRRPAGEIRRVLRPGGICVIAVPAADDLIELRELVQLSGSRRSRWETVVEEMESVGLKLLEHQSWGAQVEMDADSINDALAMTYRGARHSQQSRIESLTSMSVTLSADLILLK